MIIYSSFFPYCFKNKVQNFLCSEDHFWVRSCAVHNMQYMFMLRNPIKLVISF